MLEFYVLNSIATICVSEPSVCVCACLVLICSTGKVITVAKHWLIMIQKQMTRLFCQNHWQLNNRPSVPPEALDGIHSSYGRGGGCNCKTTAMLFYIQMKEMAMSLLAETTAEGKWAPCEAHWINRRSKQLRLLNTQCPYVTVAQYHERLNCTLNKRTIIVQNT